MNELTAIQKEIVTALEQLKEKSLILEGLRSLNKEAGPLR